MKQFECMTIREAEQYAADGGQALHLHNIIVNWAKAPNCFKAAVKRGEYIAHLFDNDAARLVRTARKLGVRVILVEREGRKGQHIDLCGGPLKKAIAMCENPEPIRHVRADGTPGPDDEGEMSPVDPITEVRSGGKPAPAGEIGLSPDAQEGPQDAPGREHSSGGTTYPRGFAVALAGGPEALL